MRRCLAILLLFLSLPLTAQDLSLNPAQGGLGAAAAEPEFLPVDEAYKLALEISGENEIRLYWQIEDAYYMYKKRFKFKLEDAGGPIEVTPAYANEGIIREDEYFGISEVYYNFADVTLELERVPNGPALLTVGSQGCADAGLCYPPQKERFSVDFAQGTIGPAEQATKPTQPQTASETGAQSLWLMLLLAFVGGSILNLMPCVFPVLSLKVLSFATGSEHSKHVHGWVYAAGVVTSFVAVALLLITLQQAGAAVGWGFQLQSPHFVALLAYLFFVMGLSLSGLIEFGAGLMGTGSQLADRGGYSGSFFTGVLATIVASPCTAPFMGTALGFAVTQTAPVALSVFAALGAGMAAPMLLLSYSRALRERMPRPGPWMETFKHLLAFPLYATAIWLLWVTGRQTSVTAMAALMCGMLALALGLYLWRYRTWGKAVGAVAVLGALAIIPAPLLSQQSAAKSTSSEFATSEQQLERYLAEGTPVFVNVTADWCITCIANERGSLSTDAVQNALRAKNMQYLVMDWTNYDPDIAEFLSKFGRNGVPLYLVYSGKAGEAPQILPQLLTPGTVVEAISSI